MPARFAQIFWGSVVVAAAATMLLLRLYALPLLGDLPPKPDLPVPGRSYVSAYRASEVDHHLFKFGLFGFGQRLRDADILIAGSSHPQLGISASELGHALTRATGRPVKDFNLAVGYGEG